MFLGGEGNGRAASGPRRLGSVPNETERLSSGEGSERALASSVRPKPRTTAPTEAVCAYTRYLFRY